HERGNAHFSQILVLPVDQAREKGGYALHFQAVDEAHHCGFYFGGVAYGNQVGNWVHNYHGWFEVPYELVHTEQVHFKPEKSGARCVKMEQSIIKPGLEVDADGTHIAYDLAFRFLEGQIETSFAAQA